MRTRTNLDNYKNNKIWKCAFLAGAVVQADSDSPLILLSVPLKDSTVATSIWRSPDRMDVSDWLPPQYEGNIEFSCLMPPPG